MSDALSDTQSLQMLLGSRFLFDLATWNQGIDDLRGVEFVAIVGNAYSSGQLSGISDALVSVTSASGYSFFGVPLTNTRVVPYCHSDNSVLACAATAPALAKVTDTNHLSFRIIDSFLKGTDDWKSIGLAIPQAPTISQYGGIAALLRDGNDNELAPATVGTQSPSFQAKANSNIHFFDLIGVGRWAFESQFANGSKVPWTHQVTAGIVRSVTVKLGTNISVVLPATNGMTNVLSLAPGSFATIYGNNLASQSVQAATFPYPTSLADIRVTLNGRPISLQYVGPTQINCLLPEDIVGLATLTVFSSQGQRSLKIFIESAAPTIFTQDGSGRGVAAAIHQDGSLISAAAPARVGEVVTVFATGLGATRRIGNLDYAILTPAVSIDGLSARVLYAGRAPGFAGLDQINIEVPTGSRSGSLVVVGNNRTSNPVTLPVR